MSLKNVDLIDCWISAPSNNKVTSLCAFVEQKLGNKCCNKKEVLEKIRVFNSKISKYWSECKGNRKYFNKKYSKWLNWNVFDLDDVRLNMF